MEGDEAVAVYETCDCSPIAAERDSALAERDAALSELALYRLAYGDLLPEETYAQAPAAP